MIDFIVQLYSTKKRNRILDKVHFYFFKRKLAIVLFKIYSLYYNSIYFNNESGIDEKSRIIVSLTSFPARIDTVWMTIDSIMRQSMKPKRILLWLSSLQFKNGIIDLPMRLRKMQDRGLEIYFVDEDIGSHKKYYYSLLKFPNSYIVTIDDDFLYQSNLLKELYMTSIKYNNAVVCNYARLIKRDTSQNLLSYNQWEIISEETFLPIVSKDIFFGSGGGTIFPPHTLYKDSVKKEAFMLLTPKADDVWLNAMCRLNKSHIVFLNSRYDLFPLIIPRNVRLADVNIDNNFNDIQISDLNNYYNNKIFI